MNFRELILKNRSCRRFFESQTIERAALLDLIDLARLSPSGANLQPLKYIISNEPSINSQIFENLAWAGYLKDWPGPENGERPAAYIIILGDKEISKNFGCDHGIAAQTILLGATEKGLAGCMIGSVRRDSLRQKLQISHQYEILMVIALGKSKEEIIIEHAESGDIKYWRDEQGRNHVPKRYLDEIVVHCP